jgi:hypothetical protein
MRAVYLHGHEDGERFYEERIVLFRADTVESAFELAERDSKRYLQLNPQFQRVGEWIAFGVHAAADLSGVEIWSGLSHSDLAPTDYYEARYGRFELQPDAEDATD